eukprot:tig00021582_g22603.t1
MGLARPLQLLLLALVAAAAGAAAAAGLAAGVLGADVSIYEGRLTPRAWQCLANHGVRFAVIELCTSLGGIVPFAAQEVAEAKALDAFLWVDGYVFLNFRRDPEAQIQAVYDALKVHKTSVRKIWIDVENKKLFGTCVENPSFFRRARKKAEELGFEVGVYSNALQWKELMCGNTEFNDLELWYAHYDWMPDVGDFAPFGGWGAPAVKQYAGDVATFCGIPGGVDLDFAPEETVRRAAAAATAARPRARLRGASPFSASFFG